MSYPPQQPGQSSYQGLGAYSGGPGQPKKKRTGMIVAIVAVVLLVLGGGGTAIFILTKGDGDDDGNTSANEQNREPSDNEDKTSGDTQDDAANSNDSEGSAGNSPEDVRDAYIDAYESKDFQDVVDSSCRAYKKKFGTDTAELEDALADYEIIATADGDPDVNGNTASAKIDLELTSAGTTETPTILIKIVEEDGQWRFCGESKA